LELAESLYLQAVSTEHILVQVRTISRTLFDLSIDGGIPERVRRELALAISTASYAVADKPESEDLESTANDLRASSNVLRDLLIKQTNVIPKEVLVKLVSIVSNLEVIADSLDESAPAITEVPNVELSNRSWFKRLWRR
jgi:hypothetical protein